MYYIYFIRRNFRHCWTTEEVSCQVHCMKRHYFLAVLFLFVGIATSFAQVSAAFSADTTEGCGPLVVQFFDQSTGNPTSWTWSLGDGNVSLDQNPQAIYSAPGTYTVSLTASDSLTADSVSMTAFITVFANPTSNFTASSATAGCVPHFVQFQDLSQPGDTNIISWLWDFSDGNTNTTQVPSNMFALAGNYNVSLQVVDANGCESTLDQVDYINVSDTPTVSFTAIPTYNCIVPAPVTFTNNSIGDTPLSSLGIWRQQHERCCKPSEHLQSVWPVYRAAHSHR